MVGVARRARSSPNHFPHFKLEKILSRKFDFGRVYKSAALSQNRAHLGLINLDEPCCYV